jgi:hypothetical protein
LRAAYPERSAAESKDIPRLASGSLGISRAKGDLTMHKNLVGPA